MVDYINERHTSEATSPICTRCQLLDLDEAFHQADDFYGSFRGGLKSRSHELCKAPDGVLYYDNAFLVHCFQDRLSFESDCSLCKFFRNMRIQSDAHTRFKLLAFPSSESWLFNLRALEESDIWDAVSHTVFMAVVPDVESITPNGHEVNWLEKDVPSVGLICRLRPNSTSNEKTILCARQLGQHIEFSVLREWFSFCNDNHDRICQPDKSKMSVSQGFRLIDCMESPPVVESKPWETRYAALSYVWGNYAQEHWPKTVQDAMAVTRAMGLQYLWVDQLCISQDNAEEIQYLISAMASIYSNAEFTIVAATGTGSNDGLPGVRSNPRPPQPNYVLESGSMLVSTLQDPRLQIAQSKWYERGWTYQESILSNRRLVFTESQVYWECRCMAVRESIQLPLNLVHGRLGRSMADFMLGGILNNMVGSRDPVIADDTHRLEYGFPLSAQDGILVRARGLEEHIRAFSSRAFREDTDSLRGFPGIISLYQSNTLRLFLGIPFWTGDISGRRLGANITFALSICSWYHRRDGDLRMFASEERRRRYHLPSWTWAGWAGTVSWRAPPEEEHCAIVSSLIESKSVDLLWAADISVQDVNKSRPICLADLDAIQRHSSEDAVLLEIKNPLVLTQLICKPAAQKEWRWRKLAGRSGMHKLDAGNMEWDSEWLRLAGKLVFRSVSISMSTHQWSEKHISGEFISILMFAGRLPAIEHGRARFLTLRKVHLPNADQRWERVGIVQLQISKHELNRCGTEEEFLALLPVRRESGSIMIT